MALPALLISVGGAAISRVASALITSLLTEKMIITVAVKILDKVFLKTKNKVDDELWPDFRAAMMKSVEDK